MRNDSLGVKTWTVLSMLEWATDYFVKHQVDQPRLSIEWLLADVLKIPRLNLYLQFDRPLSAQELDTLRPLVKRRAAHEPLQYISGKAAFMSRDFEVTPAVLIPRPETEELVAMILKEFIGESSAEKSLSALDIGTGSGCIITSLAAERPAWECYGIDISTEALEIAHGNAHLHKANVHFLEMNLFELATPQTADAADTPFRLPISFDLIVSNPPYINPTEAAEMDPQVLNFEPAVALFTEDPLHVMETILSYSSRALAENGMLFIELNPVYAEQILKIGQRYLSYSELRIDDGGKQRFLVGKK